MASPKSLKRSYHDAGLDEPVPVSPTASAPVPLPAALHDQGPYQSSTAGQANGVTPVCHDTPLRTAAGAPSTQPVAGTQASAKKTKLTFEEKELRRIELDFKAREKADEKARKEEEKRVKEIEKVEKRKAKEQLAQAKQEEKRAKEEAKRKQEDEKNKKSRTQLRLNAFFTQPSMPNRSSSGSPTRDAHSPLSSRRSSISEIQAMEAPRRSRSVSITPKKAQPSDYERQFKPFYMPSNTTLAPYNRPSRDDKGVAVTRDKIDEGLKVNLEAEKTAERQGSATMLELLPSSRNKVHRPPAQVFAVKDIMEKIDGTTSRPIDLTGAQLNQATDNPLHLLASISMKCLKFAEDVRPPYIGTYTRLRGAQSISRLARNPFGRGLPNTNYDYDSEAEWEDPIDGEDLDSEGEEDADDDGDADEMAGFLDDEEATDLARAGNRRPVLGNQEPTCTGICWEGPRGHIDQGLAALDWRLLKLDILMENPRLPIDPYCSEYWLPTTSSSSLQLTPHAQSTLMEPPRFPLHPVNRNNAQLSSSALTRSTYGSIPDRSAPMKATKPQRQIPPELMDDFKVAVQGNDLTKVGLLEILKKKFPKQPKDAIKDTLEMIAERVGPKTAEKKWMLKSGI